MSKLSIVIVNFNTYKLTAACIDSIFKYPPDCDFEILVVDNASSDGSSVKLAQRKDIKLIASDVNVGFASGNNLGIKKASGKYILLLNSDTLVTKDALAKLYNFAIATPNLGVVGPKLLNSDKSTQGSVFQFPTVWRAMQQYWFGKGKPMDKYAPIGKTAQKVDALVMAAYMISPAALVKVGLLDERYFMFFEDIDYSRKVHAAGLDIYYLPNAEVVHLHGASGKDLKTNADQWRRLVPSSKIYHGTVGHYIISFIIWTGQKWRTFLKN